MKQLYRFVKPMIRYSGNFALLLTICAICCCCGSDPAVPDTPAGEGGEI